MGDEQQASNENAGQERRASDALIIVPVQRMVLFPGMIVPIAVARERSIAAVQEATRTEKPIGILMQYKVGTEAPGEHDVSRVGTMARVLRYMTGPDGTHHIVCQGEKRFRVLAFHEGPSYLTAQVQTLEDFVPDTAALAARLLQLRERLTEVIELMPQLPQELAATVQSMKSPAMLADLVAGMMDIEPHEKQEILETIDVERRIDNVLNLIAYRIEVLRLSQEIGRRTRETLSERQREHLLREQLKTIQQELGDSDDNGAEIAGLAESIENAGMPPEVKKQAQKELQRLQRTPEAAGDYSMIRNYIDWMIELPWSKVSEGVIDIPAARRILDDEHFGLDKIKRRILEFLAVRKLKPDGRSPILCFVGPPGVGKTSLGQSIAHATGREFARVSVGGVHDEAEIRGHRRTYIGALPGNIIQAIRKAGTRDCVMMLDEIDKLGQGIHGDPSAALLEVLDPEQNSTFRDNYLGVPFDLSKVMFIATANMLDTIPGPLRDRMEIISLSGYTEEEKLQIAHRYLVQRQLDANGLDASQLELTEAALRSIIHDYTREAGVRSLEREIGRAMRHAAMRLAEGSAEKVRIDADDLPPILGQKKYESEVAMRTSVPGVATGLAWTPVGGDILFIEANRVPGNGKLILTGQLGDVMKESVQAALTLLKGRCSDYGIDPAILEKSDIHVHVPAGAIPKDGPSAGVAMFIALTSLLSGKSVRSDAAMTGEISLRGLVLPVGGIKEKVIAAMQAGIRLVMLPARNRRDLDDIPAEVRNNLEIKWLETVDQAVETVLGELHAVERA
jgi:ATP-dependent Lon protease